MLHDFTHNFFMFAHIGLTACEFDISDRTCLARRSYILCCRLFFSLDASSIVGRMVSVAIYAFNFVLTCFARAFLCWVDAYTFNASKYLTTVCLSMTEILTSIPVYSNVYFN